jgi:hypothetical protein
VTNIRVVSRDGQPIAGSHLGVDLTKVHGPPTYLARRLALTDGKGPPHMIAGSPSAGKTIFCQDLLLSLATGTAPFGSLRPLSHPIPCVHIDLEQGEADTVPRYQRLARAKGLDIGKIMASGMLRVECKPPIKLRHEDRDQWLALMTDRRAALIDSFSLATMGLADQNSPEIAEPLYMLASITEQTGCRGLLTHHFNKAGVDRLRGSTAIRASIDCLWMFYADESEDRDPEEPLCVKAVHDRPSRRDGEKRKSFAYTVRDVIGGASRHAKWGLEARISGTALIVKRRESSARARGAADDARCVEDLLKTVALYPDMTSSEIAIRMKIAPAKAILAIMNAGDRLAKITPEATGRGRPRVTYALAKKQMPHSGFPKKK